MVCQTDGSGNSSGFLNRSETGFVLPAVVVSILALAVIVAGIVTAGRKAHETYLAARNQTETRLGLESALTIVQAGLVSEPKSWPPRPTPYELELEGKRFQVRLQAAAGLIDLNSSEPRILEQYLLLAGADLQTAQRISDRIADWRDPDELSRGAGAEIDAYEAARLFPPRNGPFREVSELVRVLGVSPELADCLGPFLTVDSGLPSPQRAYAPQALFTLSGNSEAGPVPELVIGSAVEVEVHEMGPTPKPMLTAVIRTTGVKGRSIITHSLAWRARPDRLRLPQCFKR